MWVERRRFFLDADEKMHSTIMPTAATSSSFITAFVYATIPFDSTDEWCQSSEWYIVNSQEARVSETPTDIIDDGGDIWQMRTPSTMEFLLIGWSDGSFVRRLVVPSWASFQAHRCPLKEVASIYKHKGDVMAVVTLGTLVASVDASGSAVVASYFPDPLVHACIPHHSALRSVVLWEGKSSWQDDPSEAAIVYMFTGDDCGRVRLWRVDVSGSESFVLVGVFVCSVYGIYGDPREAPGTAPKVVADACLFALSLDGEARLLAASSKRLFVWNLDDDMDHTGSKPVPADWSSAAQHSAVGSSRYLHSFVVLKPAPPCHHQPQTAAERRRKKLAASSTVGQVTNRMVSSACSSSTFQYSIMFSDAKKCVEASLDELLPVTLSSLACTADDCGPVHGICVLSDGFFVTGGADGGLRLWNWSYTSGRYELIQYAQRAHSDLIKCVGIVTAPASFYTASLDGLVKTWRVDADNGLGITESSCVGVVLMESGTSTARREDHEEHVALPGVSCAALHTMFGALFVSLQMQATIVTYTFEDVAMCALPPGWMFDGWKSIYRPLLVSRDEHGGRRSAVVGDVVGIDRVDHMFDTDNRVTVSTKTGDSDDEGICESD